MTVKTTISNKARIIEKISTASKFILVTHEHPDGDALGSLIAMGGVLTELGKEVQLFVDESEFPLPNEYRFLPLENLITKIPSDIEDVTAIFLDCGNIDRTPAATLKNPSVPILNIDHHHDNTEFGTVNYVVPQASCTAEIVWDLMNTLGVCPNLTIAEALYIGLVTDTGRFMYKNTGQQAHIMAAELIKAGVDVQSIYRKLYEDVPEEKVLLLGRALSKIRRFDEGRLTLSCLHLDDFASTGADEQQTEGIVDHLRGIDGTVVAALIRDRFTSTEGSQERKVSLRGIDNQIDVSKIARAQGGGGHPQAAGFSTQLSCDQLASFLREQISSQLS